MKTLQEQLRPIVLEYTRQTAELLGKNTRDCYWVGTDNNTGIYTFCDFGDTTYLSLSEMQTIIDNIDEWLSSYGSRQAVADIVNEWLEWRLQDGNTINGQPQIPLIQWLSNRHLLQ